MPHFGLFSKTSRTFLEEIHSTRFRQLHCTSSPFKLSPQPWASTKRPKSCPLCKQAGHHISTNSHPTSRLPISIIHYDSPLTQVRPNYLVPLQSLPSRHCRSLVWRSRWNSPHLTLSSKTTHSWGPNFWQPRRRHSSGHTIPNCQQHYCLSSKVPSSYSGL